MAELPRFRLTSFCLTGRIYTTLHLAKFAEILQRLVARAQMLTIAAQQRHKCYYDAKHAAAVFAVIDEVLLSTAGLQVKISGTNKLAPKWIGPFNILEVLALVLTGLSFLSP